MITIKLCYAFGLAGLGILAAVSGADAQHMGGGPTRYESEGREEWQMPDKVVSLLDIEPGMVVADIGSSSGFFSRRFSPAVGPEGRVLAVDVDLEALAWLAGKAAELGMANIDTVHAGMDDPHLAEHSVDLIFFCNVLHHISDKAAYLSNLKQALKPGGRLAVIEFFKKNLPVGPQDPGHKLSWNETYGLLRDAGFKVVREPQGLPYQYFIIARPQ
jgi:ubiquinone/menaquinone biosynthesis C-methylase UbiE